MCYVSQRQLVGLVIQLQAFIFLSSFPRYVGVISVIVEGDVFVWLYDTGLFIALGTLLITCGAETLEDASLWLWFEYALQPVFFNKM